jgi:hypothetical protein
MPEPTAPVDTAIWRRQDVTAGKRILAEETAVAFSYDGGAYDVMMEAKTAKMTAAVACGL